MGRIQAMANLATGQQLYDKCPTPKPEWGQLGGATQELWEQRAKLANAGIKDWWSYEKHGQAGKRPS